MGCEGNPIGPHLEFVSTALVLLGIPKYYPADRIPYPTPWGRRKKRIILLLSKYLERDDIRDIEGLSVDGIVRGKQQDATVEQVEHDLGACVARSGI